MLVIKSASDQILKILGKPKVSDEGYRLMCYVVSKPVNDGILLFNTLTRELLHLTFDEFEYIHILPELCEKWFLVPQSLSDITYADRVKFVLRNTRKKSENISHYTIFTTTDCNARCFYCFERGRARIPMTEETAHKAATYIAKHCGGEKVYIHWFGGEPLYNKKVIDIICNDLNDSGVEYQSHMVSNSYLFDEETVKTAIEQWKLKNVQITLDGTETVYNRTKAYIYKDCQNPYKRVMNHIDFLLEAGVHVTIRLNIDRHNAEDLMILADELYQRFKNKECLSVYSHVLFEFSGDREHVREAGNRKFVYQQQQKLTEKLYTYGLLGKPGLRKKLPVSHCMANSGNALTILPGGELGLCEHYSDDHFVGHLDRDELDKDIVKSFSELQDNIEECQECFYYPQCSRLKMCEEEKECFPEMREEKLQKARTAMEAIYEEWIKKDKAEVTDEILTDNTDEELCR